MTSTKERPPYLAGFCGARLPADSHARCPGGFGDLTCSCTCHTAAPEPAVATPAQPAGPVTQLTGVRLPPLEPGSEAWLRTMSASKIAAVVGLSPWESRFSLWHRMAGLIGQQESTPTLRRGLYLEPAILEWFRDQHPDWRVEPAGSWAHTHEALFTAAPDGFATLSGGEIRCVEVKTAADDREWGEPGSAHVPPYYAAQAQWQMLVTGLAVTHFPILTGRLEFREYVVHADPEDQAFLLDEARAFMASLPGGSAPQRPDIDSHGATYEAVRELHSEIDPDLEVEVADDIGQDYRRVIRVQRLLEARAPQAKARLLDVMGQARIATHNGTPIARRQPGRGGAVALHALTPKDI